MSFGFRDFRVMGKVDRTDTADAHIAVIGNRPEQLHNPHPPPDSNPHSFDTREAAQIIARIRLQQGTGVTGFNQPVTLIQKRTLAMDFIFRLPRRV